MNQNFKEIIEKYKNEKIAIAVSGGVDSISLLHLCFNEGLDITLLHVNHKLRENAEVEQNYVVETAKKLKIPFKVFIWKGNKPNSNLEATARDVRYSFMIEYCKENNIKTLLTAHQADDQIETFLINLGRGSGIYGLSGISQISKKDGINIVRPLLKTYRSDLIKYCEDNNIKYFSDEMNNDSKYTRVKIRQNRYLLNDILGITDDRILLAIENISRAKEVINSSVEVLLEKNLKKDFALLDSETLFEQPEEIQFKLISEILKRLGKNNYNTRLKSLKNALNNLRIDSKFTLSGCTIRRFKNKIIIVREGESTSLKNK